MDTSLGCLRSCRSLSLSTNAIDRIAGLAGLARLEVLSLGRNCLKKLDGVEAAGGSLRELWVSYNQLERLAGAERCPRLRVLLASNNRVREWGEVERLAALPELEELLLVGNPLQAEHRDAGTLATYRAEVLRRLPRLKKLDGQPVTPEEREAAAAAAAAAS
jgi:dynein light chain 1